VSNVKSIPGDLVLLLLDGHSSDRAVKALEYAKSNRVIMLYFPPHYTNRLQPLDVSFFAPLDAYYNQEITKWLKSNPRRTVGFI